MKKKPKHKLLMKTIFCVTVFGLQKVLIAAQSEVCYYYKRNFATFNFTIYDLK